MRHSDCYLWGQQGKESHAKFENHQNCRAEPAGHQTRQTLLLLLFAFADANFTQLQGVPRRRRIDLVKLPFGILVGATVWVTFGTHATDQSLELEHDRQPLTLIGSPTAEPMAFWERFTSAFEDQAADNFADRFHPLGSLNWSLHLEEGDASSFQEETSRGARKALSKSFTRGLREAGVDLPVMTWLKDRQSLLADFLRNSVGNVSEESVAPTTLSYHAVERSWWDRLSENSGLRYGIRPFRTAPYAYAGVGIRDGENVILLANVRYVFRNFDEHKFELALSVPLAHGLSMDIGAGYKFDRHNSEEQLALKIFKKLDNGSMFYVGMELRNEPAVYAGLSFAL